MTTPTPGYLSGSLSGLEGKPTAFEAPSLIPTLFNVAVSLALVVLLIYLVYWALRRLKSQGGGGMMGRPQGLIQVLEKTQLGQKHALAVVEMGSEIYFLGLGEDVSLLSKVSDPAAVDRLRSQAPVPGGLLDFKEHLERIGVQLKREQWKKSKQDLRHQASDLEHQVELLRKREKDKE